MIWLPSVNFFGEKSENVNPEPQPTAPKPKPKPKPEPPKGPGMWVGFVMDQQLNDFIEVNSRDGQEKEALQEFIDYCSSETAKILNRRP